MIISSAPLRVSFFGGGSDYPDHYLKHGGSVLSSSISSRVYVTIQETTPLSKAKYIISYSKKEYVEEIQNISHPAIRNILEYLKIKKGLEINIISNLPAKTGLGSSSSFVVALIAALYNYLGVKKNQFEIGLDAIKIEQDIIGDQVGSQDQIASAIGGFNKINFYQSANITYEPIKLNTDQKKKIEQNFFLLYTNKQRFANRISSHQIKSIINDEITNQTIELQKLVNQGINLLKKNELKKFAKLLDYSWKIKKSFSKKISNNSLDNLYEKCLKNGALGGKMLGAGGGGFFLLYIDKKNQKKFRSSLSDLHLFPIKLEKEGVVVHNT